MQKLYHRYFIYGTYFTVYFSSSNIFCMQIIIKYYLKYFCDLWITPKTWLIILIIKMYKKNTQFLVNIYINIENSRINKNVYTVILKTAILLRQIHAEYRILLHNSINAMFHKHNNRYPLQILL